MMVESDLELAESEKILSDVGRSAPMLVRELTKS